ncbi:MAG: hypothetical protein ACI39E_05295 [Acutalibacteraceae bacterium]
MQKSRKLMVTSLLLAVMVILTVPPTLSWLSSTSAPVVNTFAGGAISIKLDEALVDTHGQAVEGEGAQRVTANSYKYVAGAVLDKDPTPTVLKGSEECYVFLCVENGLTDKFAINYDETSWLKVAESDGKAVYVYSTRVDASESESDIVLQPVFTKITVSENLTAEDIETLGERTLCVTAYAVQTHSLTSQAASDLAVEQFIPGGTAVAYPAVG